MTTVNAQRSEEMMSVNIAQSGGATMPASATLADAASNPTVVMHGAAMHLFNGTTWDRRRNNNEVTVLASAARVSTTASPDQTNYNARGVILILDITAVPSIETVTLTIQGKDALSGKYYTLLAGAVQVAVATIAMRVYPGLIAVGNLTASDALPRTWRANVVHSASGSFTYSVGASYIQ